MSDMDAFEKYDKWVLKKIAGKPPNVRAFLRRAYESGEAVLDGLEGLTPDDLILAGYPEEQFGPLPRIFGALAADAVTNPDQFLRGLHKKLDEIGRTIRADSLYSEFCELFSRIFQSRIAYISEKDETAVKVLTTYISLMLAASRYLTPERYDLTHLLCGCSTDGEPLYCDRYYPYAEEIRSLAYHECWRSGDDELSRLDDLTLKFAEVYRYTAFETADALDCAIEEDAFQTEEILSISPYINEYTYDILPDTEHIYDMDTRPLGLMDVSLVLADITGHLDARSRTLPANGIRYDFSYSPRVPEENRLRWLLLKEVSRGDRIVLLYKLRYGSGDLCGCYDCKDGSFYSQFMADADEEDEEYRGYIQKMILLVFSITIYLYAAATTPDGERMLRDFGEHFRVAVSASGKNRYPISVTPHPLGGELRNTFEDRGEPPETAEEPCGDGEVGQKKRTLQGYIRKLAPGETPSEEDKARARELGFALAEDEVYEEPFL